MKLTPKLVEALVNLRGSSYFAVVLEGLTEHIKEETQRCIDGEGATQLRASGGVKALQWWVDEFQKAPQTLQKIQTQQQGKKTQ